jgi:hypothetical protein
MPGILIPLRAGEDLRIHGIAQNHVAIFITAVAKQDANPDWDFDFIFDIRDIPVQFFLYTSGDSR